MCNLGSQRGSTGDKENPDVKKVTLAGMGVLCLCFLFAAAARAQPHSPHSRLRGRKRDLGLQHKRGRGCRRNVLYQTPVNYSFDHGFVRAADGAISDPTRAVPSDTAAGHHAVNSGRSFFLPVAVLSARFRNTFPIYLREAFRKGQLHFHGELAPLAQPDAFNALCDHSGKTKWAVYAKAPFGGPEQVLRYLARLHPSSGPLQQSSVVVGGWPSYLSMERLQGPKPDQDNEAGRGRVHAPLSPACLTAGLCAHPPIRFPRQSRPQAETGPVSFLAEHPITGC